MKLTLSLSLSSLFKYSLLMNFFLCRQEGPSLKLVTINQRAFSGAFQFHLRNYCEIKMFVQTTLVLPPAAAAAIWQIHWELSTGP